MKKLLFTTSLVLFICSLIPVKAFSQSCLEMDYVALRALYMNTNNISNDYAGWPDLTFFMANPTYPAGLDMGNWGAVTTDVNGCVTAIEMDDTSVTGTIPPEFGNFSQIQIINLDENAFSGPIPPELGNLSTLKTLILKNNSFSGDIPIELGNLTELEELLLQNNSLTGNIPVELGNLTNLQRLHLYNCNLSGVIPSSLGNLTNLAFLFLHENNLSGSIPVELGNLDNLELLFLDYNNLSGSIPAELGNLNNLEILNLHNNNLSGRIPGELGNLTNLEYLQLQNNALTGCYDANLSNLCSQLNVGVPSMANNFIVNGNMLDESWTDFCNTGAGTCTVSNEDIQASRLSIYPNPASDFAVIDINYLPDTQIHLYDVNGKLVHTQILPANNKINLQQFSEGIYFYHLDYNHQIYTGKILIE